MKTVGDYEIGFAIEEAEGMYQMVDGALRLECARRRHLHAAGPRRAADVSRHERINGQRFAEAADVEFAGITVRTGQD